MEPDSDLSASLPDPPPPRPAARDSAIEAAMQRFDAATGSPKAVDPPRPATPPRRPWIGGPRMGALVTVALVAVVGVPVWMTTSPRFATDTQAPSPVVIPSRPAPASPPGPPLPVAADIAPPVVTPRGEPTGPLSAGARVPAAPTILPTVKADVAPPLPPPPMEMKRSAASAQAESAFLAAPVAAPPPAAAAPPAPVVEDSADANIVVTGTRVSRSSGKAGARARMASKRARRGDWNACTVDDPGRDLGACRKLVDPAAPGPAGRAAAQVADGLSLAWRGDVDGAIAAFDRAIGVSPRLAIAWLNRGLSRERKGELAGAIADLDRAVRYAPNAARGYYNRSLLLRRQGDVRRADADADRAVDLDPRYEDVVD